MDLSVVFSTYKKEDILQKSLEAYCKIITDYQWEIIIVDNACREQTRQLIDKYQKLLPIVFIVQEEPGKNSALNKALPLISSDLVLFTDNDTLPDPALVNVCVGSAEKYSEFYVFSGKILPDIALPDWVDISSHRIRSAFGVYDKGELDKEILLEDVWGANMLVRNSIFENGETFNTNVGPKGDNYIMGSETELLKRLHTQGYKAMYLAGSKVLHQIRPEQLSLQWLKNRAYRSGRGVSFSGDDNSVMLFGVPRYLLRKLVSNYITVLVQTVLGNKKSNCLACMELYFNFGKVRQSYTNNKLNP